MQEPEYRGNSLFNQLAIRSGESEFSLLLELLINCSGMVLLQEVYKKKIDSGRAVPFLCTI